MTELPPDPRLRLGPVRRPAAPDAPSTPAPDATVQLRPARPEGDGTVRLRPAVAPDPEETVRLAAPSDDATVQLGLPADDATVRLGAPTGDATVRLDPRAAVSTAKPDPAAAETVKLDPTAAADTVKLGPAAVAETVRLDPVQAPPPADLDATAPEAAAVASPDGLRRYGPGVPPRAAAVWHGEAAPEAPEPPRRRRDRWLLLPLVLLLAVLGYLLWERYGRPVAVTGVTARVDGAPSCDGTAVITGTLETDGGAGEVTYRWVRSDGTDSGPIAQHVPAGRQHTEVTLRWTFQGRGTLANTAKLEVLKPGGGRAADVAFDYSCP